MTTHQLRASDLPVVDGRTYHLDLRPEDLAQNIIVVGDPDRVTFIAEEFLKSIEVERFHRGLRTITGRVKETDQRITVTTSGMGTPSLEIVLNEIVALNEVDFESMQRKPAFSPLNVIRVGTSGGIQSDTDLGTVIITVYAVGLDNTGLFYSAPYDDDNIKMLEDRVGQSVNDAISAGTRFKGKIFPYASKAHQDVFDSLEREAQNLGIECKKGITVSNAGFFANQGRTLARIPVTVPGIDHVLACTNTGIEGLKIENIEMETSFLLYFMRALGYRAGAMCPIIDTARDGRFLTDYRELVRNTTKAALAVLEEFQEPVGLRESSRGKWRTVPNIPGFEG